MTAAVFDYGVALHARLEREGVFDRDKRKVLEDRLRLDLTDEQWAVLKAWGDRWPRL